jgi:uncharacterized integral membrane protein
MKLLRRSIFGVLFAGLMVGGWLFAHSNSETVRVDYLMGELAEVALWKALTGAGALGALVAALAMGFGLLRSRLESRRYRRELLDLESEVHQLRNLPLVSEEPPLSGDPALALSGGGAGRSR